MSDFSLFFGLSSSQLVLILTAPAFTLPRFAEERVSLLFPTILRFENSQELLFPVRILAELSKIMKSVRSNPDIFFSKGEKFQDQTMTLGDIRKAYKSIMAARRVQRGAILERSLPSLFTQPLSAKAAKCPLQKNVPSSV